jgi:hypothetical protein
MSPLGHSAPFSPHHSYRGSSAYPSNQMPPRSQAQAGPRLDRIISLPPRLQLPSIEEQLQQAQLAAVIAAASQSPASSPIQIGGSGASQFDDSHQRMAEILSVHLRQLEIRGASTPGANWPMHNQYPNSPQSQRSSFDLPPSQRSSFDMGPSQRTSFDMGHSENRRGSFDISASHRESMDYGSRRSSFDYSQFPMGSPAVRRTISVPASPATRPSNPWEASEADFQLPQRVESGKDLRASIYGRLSGHGQGRADGGEQPDLQWVNDLVQEGGDKWAR